MLECYFGYTELNKLWKLISPVLFCFNIATEKVKITYEAHNEFLLDGAGLERLVHWAGGGIQDESLIQR